MRRNGPRILLIGGTYRALCVLEQPLERGEHVAAFLGQEREGERDFCSELLEVCDRASIPARSGRKLGEETVRWLDEIGFSFVKSIPHSRPFMPMMPDEQLFESEMLGNALERLVVELGMIRTGSREGGFFIVIGKRPT